MYFFTIIITTMIITFILLFCSLPGFCPFTISPNKPFVYGFFAVFCVSAVHVILHIPLQYNFSPHSPEIANFIPDLQQLNPLCTSSTFNPPHPTSQCVTMMNRRVFKSLPLVFEPLLCPGILPSTISVFHPSNRYLNKDIPQSSVLSFILFPATIL